MDHPAAGRFDPTFAAADAAVRIAAFAREAIERDLRGWLGEREVVDAESDLAFASKDLAGERAECALGIRHRRLLVDRGARVLGEEALAARGGRVLTIA